MSLWEILAGGALVAAAVLTLLVAPQLAEHLNARRARRWPDPKVPAVNKVPVNPPMARRTLAADWAALVRYTKRAGRWPS